MTGYGPVVYSFNGKTRHARPLGFGWSLHRTRAWILRRMVGRRCLVPIR